MCTVDETSLGQAMFKTISNGMISEGLLEKVAFHLRSEWWDQAEGTLRGSRCWLEGIAVKDSGVDQELGTFNDLKHWIWAKAWDGLDQRKLVSWRQNWCYSQGNGKHLKIVLWMEPLVTKSLIHSQVSAEFTKHAFVLIKNLSIIHP